MTGEPICIFKAKGNNGAFRRQVKSSSGYPEQKPVKWILVHRASSECDY